MLNEIIDAITVVKKQNETAVAVYVTKEEQVALRQNVHITNSCASAAARPAAFEILGVPVFLTGDMRHIRTNRGSWYCF